MTKGSVQPPPRKGRLTQYYRNKHIELQNKFDELERLSIFRHPEDIGITIEYLNPSFLVTKPSGDNRLELHLLTLRSTANLNHR